jgi:2-polyprenyl-3-methyl-5-hydroxy-6-metoxy-1,4-benzoquinol methylase
MRIQSTMSTIVNATQPPDPTWLAYWDTDRGERRLIEVESEDYVTRLSERVELGPKLTVLDFGCGTGIPASLLASRVGRILLWDPAGAAMETARARIANVPNAGLIDLPSIGRDHDGTFDLIVANSVVQYMSVPELEGWIRRWSDLLAPGGAIVLSDMPGGNSRFAGEMAEFLWFSMRRGVLLQALAHGFRDIARYRAARSARPLLRADRPMFERVAAAAGLDAEWLPVNLTFRRSRLTLVLRKPTRSGR